MSDECQCPPPKTGTQHRDAFEFGRGWSISRDWETWTCTVCGKPAPASHVAVLAQELVGSLPVCEAIYRGEKP